MLVARPRGQCSHVAFVRLVLCCRSPELYVMNKGVLYMLRNEMATRITMVHMHESQAEAQTDENLFHSSIALLNMEYPGLIISALEVVWTQRHR